MYVNFPRVEFLGTALIFKEEKNCRRRFTLPIKSRLRKFSGRAGTAKQMYKKSVLQVQNCMFLCLSNYCFFDVFVAVTVVVANLGYTAVK